MVDAPSATDCWRWKGYRNPRSGYGQITLNQMEQLFFGQRTITAPVAACMLAYGTPAEGQQVLHSCDERDCCNPLHLDWGTQGDNNRQAWDRGRQRWGENHPNSQYRDSTVVALLRDVGTGMSVVAAAEKHKVNKWTAYSWARRTSRPHAWRALDEEAGDG